VGPSTTKPAGPKLYKGESKGGWIPIFDAHGNKVKSVRRDEDADEYIAKNP